MELRPRLNSPLTIFFFHVFSVKLAKLLFSEEEHEEDRNPSEVWMDNSDSNEDESIKKHRMERLASARMALSLSSVLREPACASLSLSEISKRRLAYFGKEGAEAALRCADKAIEIAGAGFWDRDEIEIEVRFVLNWPFRSFSCPLFVTSHRLLLSIIYLFLKG